MAPWAWLLLGVAIGLAGSAAALALALGDTCEGHLRRVLDLAARNPATREMTVREFAAVRRNGEARP